MTQTTAPACTHLDQIHDVEPRTPNGCEECLQTHSSWVHLRLCLNCGHVGCCDDSPNKHATGHYRGTQHAFIRSFEPDEAWAYCFPDELFFEQVPARPSA